MIITRIRARPRATQQGCAKCGGTSPLSRSWHRKKFRRKADNKKKIKKKLYKVFNDKEQKDDWVDINFSMNFNNRCKNVLLTDMSSLRVGKNILSNRLSIISNKVDLSWLNQSYETYKVNCKRLLMTWFLIYN